MIPNFSDHAANERTFLAWVRTAMALVGFGLAIAHISGADISRVGGIALVGAGLLVVLLAYVRMHVLMRRLDTPEAEAYTGGKPRLLLIAIMIALAALIILLGLHIL